MNHASFLKKNGLLTSATCTVVQKQWAHPTAGCSVDENYVSLTDGIK